MKTLRKKFIIFAMSAVTVLLLVLVLAINGLNLYFTNQQENIVLETLVNADGNFRQMNLREPPPADSPMMAPLFPQPNMDQMRSQRFFIVRLDPDGSVSEINLDQIFSVSEEQAEKFARTIFTKQSESGKIDRFRYKAVRSDDGIDIFFVDNSRQRENLLLIGFVSTVIAAASWLLVLIFVILISGKVVQPILEGYEKQKRFITDAEHELKTPLAIIQTNNDAMTLIHGENKYNKNIKSQVIRLSKLTADLLMLARFDEGIVLPQESINISTLTAEVLPSYRDTAEALGFTFTSRITPDLMIKANPESVTKLITILLDNAVKYCKEGGEIRLEIMKDGNHIVIREENSCDQPENKDAEQLFERFYRGDAARTQQNNESGYGIGLSIARMICENLGGSLKAEYIDPDKIRFTAVL